MPGWEIQRAGALPGDDGQLLILARLRGTTHHRGGGS